MGQENFDPAPQREARLLSTFADTAHSHPENIMLCGQDATMTHDSRETMVSAKRALPCRKRVDIQARHGAHRPSSALCKFRFYQQLTLSFWALSPSTWLSSQPGATVHYKGHQRGHTQSPTKVSCPHLPWHH